MLTKDGHYPEALLLIINSILIMLSYLSIFTLRKELDNTMAELTRVNHLLSTYRTQTVQNYTTEATEQRAQDRLARATERVEQTRNRDYVIAVESKIEPPKKIIKRPNILKSLLSRRKENV